MENKGLIRFPEGRDAYTRVDSTHVLDLYLGRDNLLRYTLLLLTEKEPPSVISSQVILIESGLRSDGKWTFSFTLSDDQYFDLFCRFCSDIIESSRDIKEKKKGPAFIYSRYNKWQKMLKQSVSNLLDIASIKGLIGELIFLKDYMIPNFGIKDAVSSWLGPEGSDQDFVINDEWFEVKSTTSGSSSVAISSIDQLDNRNPGKLAILYLDKTSITDSKKVSLNSLYDEIMGILDSESEYRFNNLMMMKGYIRKEEYDKYVYNFKSMNLYSVANGFPRLTRQNVSDGIENAVYDISIPYIQKFMEE